LEERPLDRQEAGSSIPLSRSGTRGKGLDCDGNLKRVPETARNGVTVLLPADYLAHLVSD